MTSVVADILAERAKRYGMFKDRAMIAQTLKEVMQGNCLNGATSTAEADIEKCAETVREKWISLQPDQREALEMIAHKIARILGGDPDYIDNWDDIAGYSTLVANRLRGNPQ